MAFAVTSSLVTLLGCPLIFSRSLDLPVHCETERNVGRALSPQILVRTRLLWCVVHDPMYNMSVRVVQ